MFHIMNQNMKCEKICFMEFVIGIIVEMKWIVIQLALDAYIKIKLLLKGFDNFGFEMNKQAC